jgi:C1A family cysteine protease
MGAFTPPGLGWHRDLPDPRDFTRRQDLVARLLNDLPPSETSATGVDLREYCLESADQGGLATSSVHACLGLVQYFERRSSGRIIEPSRLFLYRIARRLIGWSGDSGLPLRTTLQAIARFGLAAERHWPYDACAVDAEPDAFVYAAAERIPDLVYLRLDGRGERPENTLENVKRFLAAGFPCVFGFPVCTSVSHEADIPTPTVFDGIRGGQAALAVGFDDTRRIRSDRGALLIINSWGKDWGDSGAGWLPFAYVREQLAVDFWTALSPEWLTSGDFCQPK